MFFRRIKREKKEKKASSDDDESEFIMETIAVAGFVGNQWEKHQQKKINKDMSNALETQNTQNAYGVQGAAMAQEGSRLLRQNRWEQDLKGMGATASDAIMQNLSQLHDSKQTFGKSATYSKALDFGKKSVWDKYNLQFQTLNRQDEDQRIEEITQAYSSAADFKSSAQDIEAQIRGLK